MAVNKKKLKKQKKVTTNPVERPISYKDVLQLQEYGHVTKVYGSGRFELNCVDGVVRLAHSRGSLRKKKVFVKLGDTVIVSLREFQDNKCDILHVYTPKEVKFLIQVDEIPPTYENATDEHKDFADLGFDCGADDSDDADDVPPQIQPIDIDLI